MRSREEIDAKIGELTSDEYRYLAVGNVYRRDSPTFHVHLVEDAMNELRDFILNDEKDF